MYNPQQPPMAGTSTPAPDEDDHLGPLPSGWEKRVQPEGNFLLCLKPKLLNLMKFSMRDISSEELLILFYIHKFKFSLLA